MMLLGALGKVMGCVQGEEPKGSLELSAFILLLLRKGKEKKD